MPQSDTSSAVRIVFRLVMAGLALILGAGQAAAGSNESALLGEIGLVLESARATGHGAPAVNEEALTAALTRLLEAELPRERRAQAALLAAAIYSELDEHKHAEKACQQARKLSDGGDLSDEAEFLRIASLEAMGRDKEAAKAWQKWLRKYGDGPLRTEALLARAWNALRRGDTDTARASRDAISADSPWLRQESRFMLLEATLHYLHGDVAAAASRLTEAGDSDAALYLRALCHRDLGEEIKGAARFQELANRHADSPLRDRALLAKANIFFRNSAYESAADEFARLARTTEDPVTRAESALRWGAAVFLMDRPDSAVTLLRDVTTRHAGTKSAANAQFLLGELRMSQNRYQDAIIEFNRVLADYFAFDVAASAQFHLGRCLSALDREGEALSAYQAVITGFPLQPEAPAAGYLTGVGLIGQKRYREATPYLQLVLDRYVGCDAGAEIVFASVEDREILEASLCLLVYAYHRTGDLGQLSGAPHLLLKRMPPSASPWRAYALLLDADALAAQGRFEEAGKALDTLSAEYPEHETAVPASQLLAWIHAQRGEEELAIATAEDLIRRFGDRRGSSDIAAAHLCMAQVRFNQKHYAEAAESYEAFVGSCGNHTHRLDALYQLGLCYLRLDLAGNAADRWDALVNEAPTAPAAERAWTRLGNLYFLAEDYAAARERYEGLLTNFAGSHSAALAKLRIAQCAYNVGEDEEALAAFSHLIDELPGTHYADEAQRGIERALYRLGQSDGGQEMLARLVERYPSSQFAAEAQFRIATQHYEAEQFAEAADAFRRVVSQFPAYAAADRAQFLMADALERDGRDAVASRAYEQFLRFFRGSDLAASAQFRLGGLRFAEDDYMRAAVAFTAVLENEGAADLSAASRYNLALCHEALGQSAEAVAELERYRQDHPSDERAGEIAYRMGMLRENEGNLDAAVAEYGTALAAAGETVQPAEMYFRRGSCRERLGDQPGALRDYARASAAADKRNPFRISALANTASLYEEGENYEKALLAYLDLIDNASDDELVAAAAERAEQLEAILH